MSEWTPIDPFSGTPYPLSPVHMEDWSTRYGFNTDHLWHGRANEPLLRGVGGLGLRESRVQEVNALVHECKHDNFVGARLPSTDDERLRPIVLAAAGYMPDQAIAFDRFWRPRMVRLSPELREAMWLSGEVRVGSPYRVREFLCNYVLQHELPINESMIDEFLHTRDDAWRMRLGNGFLRLAAREVMEPLQPAYAEALEAELLYPPRRAQTIARFVSRVLLHPEYQVQAHRRLRERLVEAA